MRKVAWCGPIASQLSITRLISERPPQNGIKISKYSIRTQANIISISNNSHSIFTKMHLWKIRMTCNSKPASLCITRKMPRSAILQQEAARLIVRRLITATIIHRGRAWQMRLFQPSYPMMRINVFLSTVDLMRKSFYPNNT